jgi:hypothetical protein
MASDAAPSNFLKPRLPIFSHALSIFIQPVQPRLRAQSLLQCGDPQNPGIEALTLSR